MRMSSITFALGTLVGCAAPPIYDPATDPQLVKAAMQFTQGAIFETKDPVNLAINGDGFFVLARGLAPKSWDDVILTRDGAFHLEFSPRTVRRPDGSLLPGNGTYRLTNKSGFYVMGYRSSVSENVRPFGTPPEDTHGTKLSDLSTVSTPDTPGGTPLAVPLAPVEIELATNPKMANDLTFDPQGLLRMNGEAPRDASGQPANMYVALAKVELRLGLRRMNGDFGAGNYLYQYQPAAGMISAGVAGTGNITGQRVGTTNTLSPGAVEQPAQVSAIDDVFAQLHGLVASPKP
ncbi:MAG: hypothetical protein JWM80_5368 [Cyanobacteria bacterium RYN_339]|nr:hypothetical protein [Cyanobacteria bacterium RYN_339]